MKSPAAHLAAHRWLLLTAILLCAAVPAARATLIQYDLVGTAGAGLLPGNQSPAAAGGTGGELASGITFDDVTKLLTINVGWGASNGFVTLTGPATAAHIHGPTPSAAPASYTENVGVLFGLTVAPFTYNNNAATGSITGSITLDAAQEGYLTNGQLYLNVHTAANPGGEIRGNLVISPTVLAVDFNDRSNGTVTNTANGFTSFLIASNISSTAIQTGAVSRAYGTYTVSVSGSGANPGYDDRLRTTPNNSLTLTLGQLYRDFVFSPDTASGGLNVTVDGLIPNQAYRVTGWSFDQGTTGGRLSDWSANGSLVVDNYFFNGSTLPTTDGQNTFTFKVSASPSGQIAITGRRDSTSPAGIAVFLNALKLEITTPDAPTILAAPVPAEVYVSDNMAFTATAGGTAPFAYQWYHDGSPVSSATNPSLPFFNVQPADAGFYALIISNPSGSITSTPVALVVNSVASLSSGLIAYWPLDSLGVSTPDLSGRDQELWSTNLSGGNLNPSPHGQAPYLDGNTQYLVRTLDPTNALPAYRYPAYTVSMWVSGYYTNQGDRRVWCEGSTNSNTPLISLGTDNAATNAHLDVFIRNNDGITPHNHRKGTLPVFDGTWHHLAWVDNNGVARLYVDGVLDGTDFSYTRGVLTANVVALGAVHRTTPLAFYNGSFDEVAIWRRSLTQAEVQAVRNSGPGVVIPPTGFTVTIEKVGNNIIMSCPTEDGHLYRLYSSETVDGIFTPTVHMPIQGTGGEIAFGVNPNVGPPAAFYKIRKD
jgi:hypothetical protein